MPAAGDASAAPGGLKELFEDPAAPGAAPGEPAAPTGPLWPGPIDLAVCKAVGAAMLKDRTVPADTLPDLAAAARKVVGGLASVEREALEKSGPDSHLYEALHVRMAMAVVNSSAMRLFASQPPAVVDTPSLTALVQLADSASKRLQAEADKAISSGQVEALQMVTAASSALSREQLALKESADRLRGIAAAPRLGAGALDPDVQIAGQAPRPQPRKGEKEEKKEVRAELRDFADLDDSGRTERSKRALFVGLGVLALAVLNALYFSHPGARTASQELVERAGTGVLAISVAEKTAMVTVTKAWLAPERRRESLRTLCDALTSVGVAKAALVIDGGGLAGQVDVAGNCAPWGLPGGKGQPTPSPGATPGPGK